MAASLRAAEDLQIEAAQGQLMRRAAMIGLLMRHCVSLIVAIVALADPASGASPTGKWLLVLVALWSVYRIATRSPHPLFTAVDYALVLAVCLAIPILVPDPEFYLSNSAPQAIAGTAVIGFAVSLPARVTLPLTLGVAAAYAMGSAAVVGWHNVAAVAAIYYFGLQWLTAGLIRIMVLRVARAVDRASAARQAAELDQQVNDAVRAYDREQLALLHDTAASTLLLVGQGAALSPHRLAAQASRDLEALEHGPWSPPPEQMELVAALRDCAAHVVTPVVFDGLDKLWLVGDVGTLIAAAAREVMNNVDRHAHASLLRITVTHCAVLLEDDGVGFDLETPRIGHGVTDSIVDRMRRARGHATITSSPGTGTSIELSWAAAPESDNATGEETDPDRLIERIRTLYGLALVVYALANLWWAATPIGRRARSGGACCRCCSDCPTRRGAAVLVGYWMLGAVAEFVRNPEVAVLVNIGLGTASILAVQLFALLFNGLVRSAAVDARAETAAHQRVIAGDRVSQALHAEYQRRYARVVDNVIPLLRKLGESGCATEDLQRRARAESRRLRALFDQATTFDHPLMAQLRQIVDVAEANDLDVVIDLAGELPSLSSEEIDSLVAPLKRLADEAESSLRLVVTGTTDEVNVSLVCDGISGDANLVRVLQATDDIEVVTTDDTVWVVIRHRVSERARQGAVAG
ncbi:ATP-binding protein [Mycobacterium hubeiense]|uniref:ATP-binding protein n=1 Tax=Mycobacterium hubeiense TaxID=1867256 RepID=UPI001E3D58EA|nr:ATP-binding protein [Mycobacterium sp. QGD 101]